MSTQPISKQIRLAVVNCGMTRYKLAQLTGIDQSALSKFVAGKVGLTLANIDELGRVLGMQIVTESPRAEKPAAKRKAKGTR